MNGWKRIGAAKGDMGKLWGKDAQAGDGDGEGRAAWGGILWGRVGTWADAQTNKRTGAYMRGGIFCSEL